MGRFRLCTVRAAVAEVVGVGQGDGAVRHGLEEWEALPWTTRESALFVIPGVGDGEEAVAAGWTSGNATPILFRLTHGQARDDAWVWTSSVCPGGTPGR